MWDHPPLHKKYYAYPRLAYENSQSPQAASHCSDRSSARLKYATALPSTFVIHETMFFLVNEVVSVFFTSFFFIYNL